MTTSRSTPDVQPPRPDRRSPISRLLRILGGALSPFSSRERRTPDSEEQCASDLSCMYPPGWDAIPPTIGMAAQPDAYFHNRNQ
jgi:hypothetical protein